MLLNVLLVVLLATPVRCCFNTTDCGSADASAPGLCQGGVCQCGIGYEGMVALVDPGVCVPQCVPAKIPDASTFLIEPNVTVTASSGNLVVDVYLDPWLRQVPTTVALLNPVDGTRCDLLPQELGTGRWTQRIFNNGSSTCFTEYTYRASFAASVTRPCWQSLAGGSESGAGYTVSFNQYRTQVEVVQVGSDNNFLIAQRQFDVALTRTFRRNYTISVATQFSATSLPFAVVEVPAVGPTAVDDSGSTRQSVPATIPVLDNDVQGYRNTSGVVTLHPLDLASLVVVVAPAHGNTTVTAQGAIQYFPSYLYYGLDTFVYQICDAELLCDNATVAVEVTPDPPVARSDGAQCGYNSSVVVSVLSNDLAGVGGFVVLSTVVLPLFGSAEVVGDGTQIRYNASAGFVGVVTLVYRICDASPVQLCDQAVLTVSVAGVGPVAVGDAATFLQNGAAEPIDVLANDLPGTTPLNVSSVRIWVQPAHGFIEGVELATGSVTYRPEASYHGRDSFTYSVCDVGGACSLAVEVGIAITPVPPTANDDAVATPFRTGVTISVLANDVPGALPLIVSSLAVATPPAHGSVSVVNGTILFSPASDFVGSDSFIYVVCDDSRPIALCDTAVVTVIVQPVPGGGLLYRLVSIDYDLIGNSITAVIQTRVDGAAKITGLTLETYLSANLPPVIGGPTTADCSSPSAAVCDQLHVIRFSDQPCLVDELNAVFTAQFRCRDGSLPSVCGFQNQQSSYLLNRLKFSYDACPRTVQYGIDTAASFLRLFQDEDRTVLASGQVLQRESLFGRCLVLPSEGASFQLVTLSDLHVIEDRSSGNFDWGDQLNNVSLIPQHTALNSTTRLEAVFDFTLLLDPTFFLVDRTYFLRATVTLTFSNFGVLSQRLMIPLGDLFRRARDVPISSRAEDAGSLSKEQSQGIFSNTFGVTSLRVAEADKTPLIAGLVGGILIALFVTGVLLLALLIRKRRRLALRHATDAPEARFSTSALTLSSMA